MSVANPCSEYMFRRVNMSTPSLSRYLDGRRRPSSRLGDLIDMNKVGAWVATYDLVDEGGIMDPWYARRVGSNTAPAPAPTSRGCAPKANGAARITVGGPARDHYVRRSRIGRRLFYRTVPIFLRGLIFVFVT